MSSPFIKDKGDKLPIESIIYSNYIRYDKMRELTQYQYQSSDANELNVYIDMDSVIKPLYKRALIGNASLYTSLILNLCAHIRAYYRTRHNVQTNIYIVFTDNTSKMTNTDYQFNSIPNRQRDEVIEWNRKMLKMIVPYFPRMYYIEGHVDSAILIKNYIDMRMNPYPNMIITKDLLCWQIPAFDSNTCIFRPSKSKTDDTSFVVNQFNCIHLWIQSINNSKSDFTIPISSSLFPLYIAFTSFKEKVLPTYFSPRDAIKRIEEMICSSQILNGYNSPDMIRNILVTSSIKLDSSDLYTRYRSIDLQTLTSIYKSYPISRDMSWNFSKIDQESIKAINDKYFIQNPLNIIHLYNI